jgi:hypothetical protein
MDVPWWLLFPQKFNFQKRSWSCDTKLLLWVRITLRTWEKINPSHSEFIECVLYVNGCAKLFVAMMEVLIHGNCQDFLRTRNHDSLWLLLSGLPEN